MRRDGLSSGVRRIQEVGFPLPMLKGCRLYHYLLALSMNLTWELRSGRANLACLLACYMVLIQSWPPHLALAPIAQADPPYMPFRDAGYSQADYSVSIQDVVYGVWRAKEEKLCGLTGFSLEE